MGRSKRAKREEQATPAPEDGVAEATVEEIIREEDAEAELQAELAVLHKVKGGSKFIQNVVRCHLYRDLLGLSLCWSAVHA